MGNGYFFHFTILMFWLCKNSKLIFLLDVFYYKISRTISTISLGVNNLISLRDVPRPLLMIIGIPAELYFLPVRKRLPYFENLAGVHLLKKTDLSTMCMSCKNQVGITYICIFCIIRCMCKHNDKILRRG